MPINDNGEQQGELHITDRRADGLGAVGEDRHLDRGRDRGLELRQHRLDAIDRRDDVGAGLPLDGENDRPLLVVPAGKQVVLRSVDRLADIAYPNRRSVLVGDDQRAVGVGREQLIVGVEGVGLARTVQGAFGKIDIGRAEHGAHGLEADAAGGERLRIDLHADRGLLLAADADKTDAGYLRDLLQKNILRIGINRGERR